MAMVSVKNLSFSFKKNISLFKNLNLNLNKGHTCGLFGLNGAGKTTLLNLISGMLFPSSGTCIIQGEESKKRRPSVMSDLFFVPEQFNLPPVVPGVFVDMHAPFYPRFSYSQLNDLMGLFSLDKEKLLSEQSYGQRKKFLISFALATNTNLLLMDEPTNGLDIPSKSQFRKVMASVDRDDRCTIISTHQVRDLESIIDKITVLHDGSIIFDQPLAHISSRLTFKKAEKISAESLYSEETMGGYHMILPQTPGSPETQIDLELLFSAIIQKPEVLHRAFNDEVLS